jgi:hypothetical protein
MVYSHKIEYMDPAIKQQPLDTNALGDIVANGKQDNKTFTQSSTSNIVADIKQNSDIIASGKGVGTVGTATSRVSSVEVGTSTTCKLGGTVKLNQSPGSGANKIRQATGTGSVVMYFDRPSNNKSTGEALFNIEIGPGMFAFRNPDEACSKTVQSTDTMFIQNDVGLLFTLVLKPFTRVILFFGEDMFGPNHVIDNGTQNILTIGSEDLKKLPMNKIYRIIVSASLIDSRKFKNMVPTQEGVIEGFSTDSGNGTIIILILLMFLFYYFYIKYSPSI